jgi:hypothetical protein
VSNDYGGGLYNSSEFAYEGSYAQFDRNSVNNNRANGDGGGLYLYDVYDASQAEFDSNTVTHNTISSTSSYNGGGVYFDYVYYGSRLTMTNNLINDNLATGDGGGVYQADYTEYGSALLFENNQVQRNVAKGDYGGCYFYDSEYGTQLLFNNNLVNNNTTWGVTGGCYFDLDYEGVTLQVQNNQFNQNTAGGDTGGVYFDELESGVTLDVSNIQLVGNRAGISGTTHLGGNYGGLYLYDYQSLANLQSNQVISNHAYLHSATGGSYGGLYLDNYEALLNLTSNTIQQNVAEASTGAVYLYVDYDSVSTLAQNLITGNTAVTDASGLYLFNNAGTNDSTTYLRRNKITGNSLSGGGTGPGVLADANGASDPFHFYLWAENNLIAGNNKGGVLSNGANWRSINDTLANNGPYGLGFTGSVTATLYVTNSIVFFQTADITNLSLTNSPIRTVAYSDFQHGVPPGPGNISANPLFVGGGDYHLTAGSPAKDKASTAQAPATDLDGILRPVGPAADMGAFEFHLVKLFLPFLHR